MKIHPDCRPCLIRQMEITARAAGADEATLRKVIVETASELERVWDSSLSPPAVSAPLYNLTGCICGQDDPFLAMKIKYTRKALNLLPELEDHVAGAADPFEAAVRIAIAGNIIDFGTGLHADDFSLEETLKEFLVKPFFTDHTDELRKRATDANSILFIGDNAGETVFDRPLLAQLAGSELYYAAKGGAIINDATVEDAARAGIHKTARLVSTGSRVPGILLEDCSEEFSELFWESDLVISKGQGNFETLTELEPQGRTFMLFTVKCPVAARYLDADLRDMIVMKW